MAKRKIVRIDEEKCNGCGQCVPNCAEGALQIIDGKAKLVSDIYCDGLGACLGHCPVDAIIIEERDADQYDEHATNQRLKSLGRPVLPHTPAPAPVPAAPAAGGCPSGGHAGHAGHHHGQPGRNGPPAGAGGCPGSRMMSLTPPAPPVAGTSGAAAANAAPAAQHSELTNWPLQLTLLPIEAPFYQDRELVLAADCAAFSMPDFHSRIIKGRALAIGCPKLDDIQPYIEKLAEILRRNRIKGLVLVHMEVPCCSGIVHLAREAARLSGRTLPVRDITVSIRGSVLSDDLEIYGPQA